MHNNITLYMEFLFNVFLNETYRCLCFINLSIIGIISLIALLMRRENNSSSTTSNAYPKIAYRTLATNLLLWPLKELRVGKFQPLSLEELKIDAIRKEGNNDFGKNWNQEPWKFMIDLINKQSNRISPLGYLLTRELFTRRLRVKLRLTAELKLSDVQDYCKTNPVHHSIFIVGMPRTGTTLLHRLLSLDRSSRAPLTWELFDPTRRVVDDPVQDCKKRITFCQKNINFLISLAPHIDQIHPMAADFPEECLMALGLDVPLLFDTFHLFLEDPDIPYKWDCTNVYQNYVNVLQILQHQATLRHGFSPPQRWILKCPLHLGLLKFLSDSFPGPATKFIWTHRNLHDSIPSFSRLIRAGMDMTVTGCIDLKLLGRNCLAFAEEWIRRGDDFFSTNEYLHDGHHVTHVMYDDLMKNPLQTIKKLYSDLHLTFSSEYECALKQYISDEEKNTMQKSKQEEIANKKLYPNGYSLSEYCLTEAEILNKLGWYTTKYMQQ